MFSKIRIFYPDDCPAGVHFYLGIIPFIWMILMSLLHHREMVEILVASRSVEWKIRHQRFHPRPLLPVSAQPLDARTKKNDCWPGGDALAHAAPGAVRLVGARVAEVRDARPERPAPDDGQQRGQQREHARHRARRSRSRRSGPRPAVPLTLASERQSRASDHRQRRRRRSPGPRAAARSRSASCLSSWRRSSSR